MPEFTVDPNLCRRCRICSLVCPAAIIVLPDEEGLPEVLEKKAGMCIACGHCEAHCPTQALVLNVHPEEKMPIPADHGEITPEALSLYMKKRRTVRNFMEECVPREKITGLLDIARYAASGGNRQPVEWLILYDSQKVQRLAALTIDWMKSIRHSDHPMKDYVPSLIAAWKSGYDPICRKAPHLLIAHIPEGNPGAQIDAIIALTHLDIAAPAFGLGTCWAGFLSLAAFSYEPLKKELALPEGRQFAYGLLFGFPRYKRYSIPRRNPSVIHWR